ncbi:MAG: DUF429 domain-containing protein [Betaproteobacteria bacterium]|nr:DUF429 domain-containing protein [Betaproteobacteria bacterium]
MSSRLIGVLGVDFTSAPGVKKPIVLARAVLEGRSDRAPATSRLKLLGFERFSDWLAYERFLHAPWTDRQAYDPSVVVGGFDFPFGLPKDLLKAWQWDRLDYRQIAMKFAGQDRSYWVAALRRFCEPRPVGHKFAHRACDGPAGSSPSMKWVNPPVVFMYREGFKRLIDAGWHLPGFEAPLDIEAASEFDIPVALEAYPGHLARSLIGKLSYKSDSVPNDPKRLEIRGAMLGTLAARLPFDLIVDQIHTDLMLEDGRGDAIDALLCAIQAAWAAMKGPPCWGADEDADPQEGWIASIDLVNTLKPKA